MSKRLQITLTDDVYTKLQLITDAYCDIPKSTAINLAIDSFYSFCIGLGFIKGDAFYKANALEPEHAWISE